MDPLELACRIDQTTGLSDEDIEMLERFAILLPDGWQIEHPPEDARWFGIIRCARAANAPPLIVAVRDNDQYSVATWDHSEQLSAYSSGDHEVCETFECRDINELISLIRRLVCEFMQTEDPSTLTPASWARCFDCGPEQEKDCLWKNPEQGSGSLGSGSSQGIRQPHSV